MVDSSKLFGRREDGPVGKSHKEVSLKLQEIIQGEAQAKFRGERLNEDGTRSARVVNPKEDPVKTVKIRYPAQKGRNYVITTVNGGDLILEFDADGVCEVPEHHMPSVENYMHFRPGRIQVLTAPPAPPKPPVLPPAPEPVKVEEKVEEVVQEKKEESKVEVTKKKAPTKKRRGKTPTKKE